MLMLKISIVSWDFKIYDNSKDKVRPNAVFIPRDMFDQALTVRQGNYINHKVNVARKEVLGKWRKSHQKKQQAQHQTNKRNRDYWRYHYDGSSGRGDRNYYRQESLEKRIAATD